jgi:hypothetical protein
VTRQGFFSLLEVANKPPTRRIGSKGGFNGFLNGLEERTACDLLAKWRARLDEKEAHKTAHTIERKMVF